MSQSKASPSQIAILVVLLAVLLVVVVVRLRPSIVSGGSGSDQVAAGFGKYSVPPMGWDRNSPRIVPTPASGRNLFTYGPPPTPTPDTRPTPTPAPTMPPRPPRTPRPTVRPGIEVDGTWYPPPPRFTLPYLGWLGPDRLPVAIFRENNEVIAVAKGGTVAEKFIVQEVGPDFVAIGYVGYPTSVNIKVSLSR